MAAVDLIIVTVAGTGSSTYRSFLALGAFVFLFVVLGLGVAISTVSKSQGEAIQLAIMTLLPQIMLSGMIFPLESMAPGVRWIGYLLSLTWFVIGMRGIFLKGSDALVLALPFAILVVMAVRFGDRIALAGVDLAIEPGQVHTVIGGDGAAKSTLLRVLAGLDLSQTGVIRQPAEGRIGYVPSE